jgi:phosphatidylserine decarboxylase
MSIINFILKLYSNVTLLFASIPIPKMLRAPLYNCFGKIVMKLEDSDFTMIKEDLSNFKNLGEFFYRPIDLEKFRPIHSNAVVSPCDALLIDTGKVKNGKLLQVKGIEYSIKDLVQDSHLSEKLENCSYFNLYLSPKDYHRFHCPCAGVISLVNHIPGAVFPVNKLGLRIPSLYARNERFIVKIDIDEKEFVCLAIIGATAVSGINIIHSAGKIVQKGDLLGWFSLGSSIVLLTNCKFECSFNVNKKVKVLDAL